MIVQEEIAEDLICFRFHPETDSPFSYNSFLFTGKDDSFLIDVGYPEQATAIRSVLEEKSLSLEYVILSHYHSDHYNGVKDLSEASIVGSSAYIDSFTKEELSNSREIEPTIKISEPQEISVCDRGIQLEPGPGHSPCSILTRVSEAYIHLGDLIIFTEEGESALPLCGKGLIKEYVETLQRLENFYDYYWILGHGRICQDIEVKRRNVESRLVYLNSLLELGENSSFAEATKKCSLAFSNEHWHAKNLMMRRKGIS